MTARRSGLSVPEPVPEPTTPSKTSIVKPHIDRLNEDYNMDIRYPDVNLSPSKRKALINTNKTQCSESIRRSLHFLACKDPGGIDAVLFEFQTLARASSSRWVPKPRADRSTLPHSLAPPRARTEAEQIGLQELLEGLLKRRDPPIRPFRTRITAANIAATAAPSAPSAPSTSLPSVTSETGSKRTSDEFRHDPVKRAKVVPPVGSSQVLTSAIDKVPVRPKATPYTGAAALAALTSMNGKMSTTSAITSTTARMSRSNVFESFGTSANTSKISLVSDVFSAAPLVATQSTVEASQELKAPNQLHSRSRVIPVDEAFVFPSSGNSIAQDAAAMTERADVESTSSSQFMPSSGLHRAMQDSFSEIAHPVLGDLHNNQSSRGDGSTHYSGEYDLDDIAMLGGDVAPLDIPAPQLPLTLDERLAIFWPQLPPCLKAAPLAICWEVTRSALHCGVDISKFDVPYSNDWKSQDSLRASLRRHYLFRDKALPEPCREDAWAAGLTTFQTRGLGVTLTAEVEFAPEKPRLGPLFLLSLNPLKVERSHRLSRRFGADRFLEIVFPSPSGKEAPAIVKKQDEGVDKIIKWLANSEHSFLGRKWAPFSIKPTAKMKTVKRQGLPDMQVKIHKERVWFFAEDGGSFTRQHRVPPRDEATNIARRTRFSLRRMLNWAIAAEKNEEQPALKLFSRIALSLTLTHSTIVLMPDQIRFPDDVVSPTNKVMNDGIGRISRGLAKQISDHLGLEDTPSGFQGRIGSAKGFWIRDICDDSADEIWIELYPSQRKFKCDSKDDAHRTFEVASLARPLMTARLNMQFIPILEDRAIDRPRMRETISKHLKETLHEKLSGPLSSMDRPADFWNWVHQHSSGRYDRQIHRHVPFLAGLPDRDEESIAFLLAGGFDPRKQQYLQDKVIQLSKRACEDLKDKLHIDIGQSAYAYMVVDFWGFLDEGEVHLGFSSKFQGSSNTLLHGIDILVARAPAHLPSDIQRVKAVFKPQLSSLQDVVVFSSKGDTPLADLLSGGDYDGDQAWVCWDPDIVKNFQNFRNPQDKSSLDPSRYLGKETQTFGDLRAQWTRRDEVTKAFIYEGLRFNMQQKYLGICTSYKDSFCYHRQTISDPKCILLGTLLGHLVDQAKQGIIFDDGSWSRLRKDVGLPMSLVTPNYVTGKHSGARTADTKLHILDFLKFEVGLKTIDAELTVFHKRLKDSDPNYWDPDLASLYHEMVLKAGSSRSLKRVLDNLVADLNVLDGKWTATMKAHPEGLGFAASVNTLYEEWRSIRPRPSSAGAPGTKASKTVDCMELSLGESGFSQWELIKASATFKLNYGRKPKFVWYMAGKQLQWMKAWCVAPSRDSGVTVLTPSMWAASRPDSKIIKSWAATGDAAGYAESVALEDLDYAAAAAEYGNPAQFNASFL